MNEISGNVIALYFHLPIAEVEKKYLIFTEIKGLLNYC